MRFYPADILLPDFRVTDPRKWAVIACDQFTSEPNYWERVEKEVGDAPSTLRLILPEVWLGQNDEERISAINARMKAYQKTVFRSLPPGYVYIERTQPDGRVRCGLIGCIDLEDYDFALDAHTPIRATEGTVLSRIPPRVKIREGAILELPHVMLLTNDPRGEWLDCYAGGQGLSALYDTPLMEGGGHLRGWFVPPSEEARIEGWLTAGASDPHMILAVGDGNHSLATAKTIYEEYKQKDPESAKTSPARYALVEVVSLRSPALEFSPIYRIVRGADPQSVLKAFEEYLSECGQPGQNEPYPAQTFSVLVAGSETVCRCAHGCHPLPVGTLQTFLDAHPAWEIDYIHDETSLRTLSKQEGTVGFLFDGMEKSELFPAVLTSGSLPRKTFSMGHARDKRYYMEARIIR